MLQLLALAALAFSPSQSPAPDPAAVKSAVTQLKEAFEKGKAPERVIAIEKASGLADATVVDWVAKGLKDGEKSVQTASIETLRRIAHADALAALLACLERDKKLQKDAELHAKLVKAIGQHASPAAIEKLAAGGVDGDAGPVIEARILAIANVRSPKAVEELVGMMRTASRERIAPYLATFRLGLMRLTGDDAGHSQEAWIAWWNDHKKDLKVAAEPPQLPKEMQLRWDYFWGNEVDVGRAKKRGDRGDDGGGKK